jgi:hypothetical protein
MSRALIKNKVKKLSFRYFAADLGLRVKSLISNPPPTPQREINPRKEWDPVIEGLDPASVRSRTAFQQSRDVRKHPLLRTQPCLA